MGDNKEMRDPNLSIEFSYDFSGVAPVSTNDMYFHMPKKTKKGKLTTYAIRTPVLKAFQAKMNDEILPKVYPHDYKNIIKSLIDKDTPYGLSLVIVYLMPSDNYTDSDTSNYIKAFEDTIVKYTGVDDKFNIILTSAKGLSYDEDWHIFVHTSVCPKIGRSIVKELVSARSIKLEDDENASET